MDVSFGELSCHFTFHAVYRSLYALRCLWWIKFFVCGFRSDFAGGCGVIFGEVNFFLCSCAVGGYVGLGSFFGLLFRTKHAGMCKGVEQNMVDY